MMIGEVQLDSKGYTVVTVLSYNRVCIPFITVQLVHPLEDSKSLIFIYTSKPSQFCIELIEEQKFEGEDGEDRTSLFFASRSFTPNVGWKIERIEDG